MLAAISETSIRPFWLCLTAVTCLLLPGCDFGTSSQVPPQFSLEASPFTPAPGQNNNPKSESFVAIHLQSVMLEVPAGIVSNSEEIWSYLEEEPVGAKRLSTLSRNGWRVGLGRSNSFDDIERMLKEMTGKPLIQGHAVTRPGDPIHLALKTISDTQTIFQFHEDKTISGSDFPEGENVLSVVCTVDPDNTDRIIVTAMPQVRAKTSNLKYQRGEDGVIIKNAPKMFGFSDMLFQLPLGKNEFIVVGPGVASRRFNSVGRMFLVQQKEGMDFETIIILKPYAVTVTPQSH